MKPIKVTELDHIVLNVKDIDKSLAFYSETLGLGIERLDEFRAGKIGFPSVRINADTIIDLFPAKEAVNRPGNLNHFCLVVDKDDFAGIVDYLKGHRVEVLNGPISRWGARGRATSVYFHDPDKNEIEIRCY